LFEIKVVTQEVSLFYFHVYMYCNPNWFLSSNFLRSTLVPLLWWFRSIWDFCIHSCIESIWTIFKFLVSFSYSTPPACGLPFMWPVFHNITAFILGL
jgi:hypothetical protein